jgi:hypothetical protein
VNVVGVGHLEVGEPGLELEDGESDKEVELGVSLDEMDELADAETDEGVVAEAVLEAGQEGRVQVAVERHLSFLSKVSNF